MKMLAAVVLMAATLGAQSTFDVVSIKPAGRGSPPASIGALIMTFRPGQMRAPGMTPMGLITRAFDVKAAQVIGAADWLTTSQYEIVATMSRGVGEPALAARLPGLLRSLLADRFKLAAHTERRPFPVYALVRTRPDGRLGSQLRPSVTDCPSMPLGTPAAPVPAPVQASADRGERMCFGGIFRAGTLISGNITMAGLAGRLTDLADRFVVDRTGLDGKFDVDLQWAPDPTAEGPSLFTAVQEQLGLKLEPRTEPIDVVVIEHIERPEPN